MLGSEIVLSYCHCSKTFWWRGDSGKAIQWLVTDRLGCIWTPVQLKWPSSVISSVIVAIRDPVERSAVVGVLTCLVSCGQTNWHAFASLQPVGGFAGRRCTLSLFISRVLSPLNPPRLIGRLAVLSKRRQRSQSLQNNQISAANLPTPVPSCVNKVQRHHSLDSQTNAAPGPPPPPTGRASPRMSPKMRPKLSLMPAPCPAAELQTYSWYVGEMARGMAIRQLEPHKSGTYLIRLRDRTNNLYALSIKYINEVMHIKIQKSSDNRYYLANTILFRTIPELVSHYQRNTLGESFPELPTTLVYAYKDAERSLQQNLGMCRALYRFSATQSNQLSLEVGDVIEIISRASGDRGWYKGRKGDKVGYFPAAYVSED